MENIGKLNMNDIYYDIPFEEFIKLAKNDNFFHGRVNDGEFNAIKSIKNSMNANGMNCDFSNYFCQLGADLMLVLLEYEQSENYIISGGNNYFYEYTEMFEEINQKNPKLRLHNGYFYYDILMHPPYFEDFNEFLKKKKVVIIGPSYMKEIKLFDNFEVIEIPRVNAYLSMNNVINKITELNNSGEPINYCFTAGMMTSIIIHKFSKTDKQNSYFNIGSVWDYFFQLSKYNGEPYRIIHRGIYSRLVAELNQYYKKYII